MLAAHDSGDRFDAVGVGDHDHGLVERVCLAVKREHGLAGAGAAHGEIALDLGEVEHVQRAAAVEGDVIGDVDKRADRSQADRAEPLLHPFGRRAVGDAAHETQGERRAKMPIGRGEIEMDGGRAVERPGERLRRRRLQAAQTRRGEIARDAGDAGRVGAVRRHRDVDDRVVEPGKARISDADRRVLRELDDPLVIVAELELRRRAQHAVRFDAADDALGEGHLLAGNIRADRRENALHARARIGRAADDLHRAAAGFDDADLEPVGVGMRLGLDDGSNHEAVILAARVVDALHFETDAGQRVDDLGERSRRVEVVEKPGEGEFHRRSVRLCSVAARAVGREVLIGLEREARSRPAPSTRAEYLRR